MSLSHREDGGMRLNCKPGDLPFCDTGTRCSGSRGFDPVSNKTITRGIQREVYAGFYIEIFFQHHGLYSEGSGFRKTKK